MADFVADNSMGSNSPNGNLGNDPKPDFEGNYNGELHSTQSTPLFLKLGDELLPHIFSFLNPSEFLNVECVNRLFRDIISGKEQYSELFYIRFLHHVWGDLEYNIPPLIPLLSRISCLPLGVLRSHLRGIDVTWCVEKKDYQVCLRSKLLFGRKTQVPGKLITYPDWTYRMNDGKATYYFARKERARSVILFKELTLFKWNLYYKTTVAGELTEPYDLVFHEDSTLTCTSHGDQRFQFWIQEEEKAIQVEHFPPHIIKRMSDGRWTMENYAVIFVQVAEPGVTTDIPLF